MRCWLCSTETTWNEVVYLGAVVTNIEHCVTLHQCHRCAKAAESSWQHAKKKHHIFMKQKWVQKHDEEIAAKKAANQGKKKARLAVLAEELDADAKGAGKRSGVRRSAKRALVGSTSLRARLVAS